MSDQNWSMPNGLLAFTKGPPRRNGPVNSLAAMAGILETANPGLIVAYVCVQGAAA